MEEVADYDGLADSVSKVGGKPAWPDLGVLPAEQACEKCAKPLVFLLQIHCPLFPRGREQESAEGGVDDPRTLFLFMCRDPRCHSPGESRCFQVLRYESNGSEVSEPSDPKLSLLLDAHSTSPDTESTTQPDSPAKSQDVPSESQRNTPEEDTPPSLCAVCGGRGTKACGGCKRVNYCSKHHQIHDWKLGHKKNCPNSTHSISTYDPSSGVVLPEWDVVTEPEPEGCGKQEERSEEERMKDYEAYMEEKVKGEARVGTKWSEVALERMVRGKEKEDKMFRTFMKRIAAERQQVNS